MLEEKYLCQNSPQTKQDSNLKYVLLKLTKTNMTLENITKTQYNFFLYLGSNFKQA